MNAVKVGIPWNECLRNIVTVCYYHLTYVFHCESTLYSCLNVKDLIAQNRCNIYNLSDSNGIGTHSHWPCKWTLKNLAKLSKWLCVILQTNGRGFEFHSCHLGDIVLNYHKNKNIVKEISFRNKLLDWKNDFQFTSKFHKTDICWQPQVSF